MSVRLMLWLGLMIAIYNSRNYKCLLDYDWGEIEKNSSTIVEIINVC